MQMWAEKTVDVSEVSDDDKFLFQICCSERLESNGMIDDQRSLDYEIVPWAKNMKIGSKYVEYEEAKSPTIRGQKMDLDRMDKFSTYQIPTKEKRGVSLLGP
jgi:hypothetical protein